MSTLFCLVAGDPADRAFSVKVSNNDTVDDLKDLIKAKKSPRFDDVAADELTLWKVSIPSEELATRATADALDLVLQEPPLSPMDEIAECFDIPPPRKHLHIVVKRPEVVAQSRDRYKTPSPSSSICNLVRGSPSRKHTIDHEDRGAQRQRQSSPSPSSPPSPSGISWLAESPTRILKQLGLLPKSPPLLVAINGPVDVKANFVVPFTHIPSYNNVVDSAKSGGCPMLFGHFQSGKTSTLKYLERTETNWIYINALSFGGDNEPAFMRNISEKLLLSPQEDIEHLNTAIREKYTYPIVLMIDEFDYYLRAPGSGVLEFLHGFIKAVNDGGLDRIKSIVCAGTYSCRNMVSSFVTENPLTWNMFTFIEASDFTREQHVAFFQKIQDVKNIRFAEDVVLDVYSRTGGYAGLGGFFAYHCVLAATNEIILTMEIWTRQFDKVIDDDGASLVAHITRNLSDDDKTNISLLAQFLRYGQISLTTIQEERQSAAVECLQALGIIRRNGDMFEFTSNIMFDILSRKYYPADRNRAIQRKTDIRDAAHFWEHIEGIMQYIKHEAVFHPMSANANSFSEYIIQGEFFSLCRQMMPYPAYKVLRETRTLPGSERKCDVWITNNSTYGIEFKVGIMTQREITNAANQALGYTKGHNNCSMFLLIFIPNDSQVTQLSIPAHNKPPDGVYFEIVYIIYSKSERLARVVRNGRDDKTVAFATN